MHLTCSQNGPVTSQVGYAAQKSRVCLSAILQHLLSNQVGPCFLKTDVDLQVFDLTNSRAQGVCCKCSTYHDHVRPCHTILTQCQEHWFSELPIGDRAVFKARPVPVLFDIR